MPLPADSLPCCLAAFAPRSAHVPAELAFPGLSSFNSVAVNPANQTAPRAALALCGFTAVVGQIVLMRELIQVFNGNEIALGILLATWLLWTAFGSAVATLFARSLNSPRSRARWLVAALEITLAASLPATLWALRSAKTFFQVVPGELVGPVPMLLTSLVCLSVFCAASGALFVAAARLIAQQGNLAASAAASAAYLVEAAGSALGGVLSSVVFVRFLDAFQIAAIVGLLNLSVAAALLFRMKRAQVALLAVAAALAAVPLLVWIAPRCDAAARARLWRGFHVVAERDSIYGNLDRRPKPARSIPARSEVFTKTAPSSPTRPIPPQPRKPSTMRFSSTRLRAACC